MKKEALYEQIEAYLNDTLSAEERQALEQRMADDPDLRQEVALHQHLQKDFDAGRKNLREGLRKVMEEPLPADQSAKTYRKSLWLLGIGLAGLILVWFAVNFWGAAETPPHQDPAPTPIQTPQIEQDTKLPAPNPPIAQIDPARYKPNASMEAFVNSKVRSESIAVQLSRPIHDARVFTDQKSSFRLRFTGTILIQEAQVEKAFTLAFFDNQNTNKPVFEIPLAGQKTAQNGLEFDFQAPLKLQPGLYYFTIEAVDEGEVLYAGRFRVFTQ